MLASLDRPALSKESFAWSHCLDWKRDRPTVSHSFELDLTVREGICASAGHSSMKPFELQKACKSLEEHVPVQWNENPHLHRLSFQGTVKDPECLSRTGDGNVKEFQLSFQPWLYTTINVKTTEDAPPYREMHVALDQNAEQWDIALGLSGLDSIQLARHLSPLASPQRSRRAGPFPKPVSECNQNEAQRWPHIVKLQAFALVQRSRGS